MRLSVYEQKDGTSVYRYAVRTTSGKAILFFDLPVDAPIKPEDVGFAIEQWINIPISVT